MESFQRQFSVVDKHPQRCTGKSEDGFKMFSVVLPEENDNTTKKAFKDFIETDSVVYLLFIICIPKNNEKGPTDRMPTLLSQQKSIGSKGVS